MSLLTGPLKDLGRPCLQAVRTLADYAQCLHSRIRSHQDPSLYTSKQGKGLGFDWLPFFDFIFEVFDSKFLQRLLQNVYTCCRRL